MFPNENKRKKLLFRYAVGTVITVFVLALNLLTNFQNFGLTALFVIMVVVHVGALFYLRKPPPPEEKIREMERGTANLNFYRRGIISIVVGVAVQIVGIFFYFAVISSVFTIAVTIGISWGLIGMGIFLLKADWRIKKGLPPFSNQV